MADLTADAQIRIHGQEYTHKFVIDSAAAYTIYKGQPLIVDQDVDATGNLVPFTDGLTVAATDVFMGIAAEGLTVASGATQNLPTTGIEAWIEPTIVGFKSAVFTNGQHNGATVYMSDSATLSAVASDNPKIGTLQFVEDGYAYVKLITAVCTGA